MVKSSLEVAIVKGRGLMKKSNDSLHDLKHAENVEQTALEIFKSEKIEKISTGLVSAAAYWHDVYKASGNGFRLNNIDGRGSRLIAEKELGNTLSEKPLKKLLRAVADHDRVFKYAFSPKSFSPLGRLLIEADMLDVFDIDRWKRGVSRKNMTYFQRVVFVLFELMCIALLFPRIFTFEKAQQIFKKKSKEFWDFFLFKESYFFKIITNRV